MRTGLLPHRSTSPAAAAAAAEREYLQSPPSNTTTSGKKPRSSPSSRRRTRRTKSRSSTGGVPTTTGHQILWCFLLAGLLATLLNIAYIANQTALRWEDGVGTRTTEAKQRPVVGRITETSMHTVAHNPPLGNPVDPFYDKKPLMALLTEAGLTPLDNATAASLPTWTEITSLYGDGPVFHGLDTCLRFQGSGIASHHFVATAGAFNTGTNLLSELLIANCHMPARMKQFGNNQKGVRWQVVWGKHTPVGNETFRRTHRTYTDKADLVAEDVFAAVMMRDPYRWMQSMCRHEYGAHWLHDKSHCPSLVPNEADRTAKPVLRDQTHIPVTVKYAEFSQHHESLAHFWNDWYTDYIHAPFPYLMVRFEDLIFYPKQVVQTVCECAGGELNKGKFKYVTGSAKKGDGAHGKDKTGYLQALSRYGKVDGRYTGMEDADLQYALQHLDPQLMQLFRYPYHDATHSTG